MKRRHILTLILCLMLAMSMLLTACNTADKKDDDKDNDKGGSKTGDVQAIIDDIGSLNLGTLIEELDKTADMSLSDALKDLACEGKFNVDAGGQTMSGYAGLKDGVIKADAMGETAYLVVSGNNMIALTPSYLGGFNVDVESGDSITEDLEESVSDKMLDLLAEFRLPAIKESQLTKEDGLYVVSEDYYDAVAKKVIDTYLALMKESGVPSDALPSDDDYDEIVDMVNGIIDALNLKLGFAVENGKISGIALSVDTKLSEIAKVVEAEMDAEDDGPIKADVRIDFDPETLVIKHAKINAEITAEGRQAKINADLTAILDKDNMPVGLNATLDCTVPANEYDYVEYGEPDEWGDYEYADININGSAEAKISIFMDLSKLSLDGEATVVDATVEYSSKFTSCTAEIYNEDTYEYEEIDPSSIGYEVDYADYDENGKILLKVQTTGKNAISFTLSAQTNGETVNLSGDASIDPEKADNFGTLPAEITSIKNDADFAEKYYAVQDIAYELEEAFYYVSSDEFSYEDSFLYTDAESGLYVYFESFYSYPEILTSAPADDCIPVSIDPLTGELVFN